MNYYEDVEKHKNTKQFSYLHILLVILFGCLVSCVEKSQPEKVEEQNKLIIAQNIGETGKKENLEKNFPKELREAIYFSDSLEREALKIVAKGFDRQRSNTLFSILSFIIETNSGVKKMPLSGLGCSRYEIMKAADITSIYQICTKPKTEIATIKTINHLNEYEIHFLLKSWEDTVGLSVVLTTPDTTCNLKIKEKKLNELRCENWSYQLTKEQASATVFKSKEFYFNRESVRQFVIKGSYLKELVENKKIDILVPISGKIKIFEKEIEVIDEFLDKNGEVKDGKKETIKIKEEDFEEKSETDQEQKEASYQKESDGKEESIEQENSKETHESHEGRGGRRGR